MIPTVPQKDKQQRGKFLEFHRSPGDYDSKMHKKWQKRHIFN